MRRIARLQMDGRRAGQASVGEDAREDDVHVEEVEDWRVREYWLKSSGRGVCSVAVSSKNRRDRRKDVPEGH